MRFSRTILFISFLFLLLLLTNLCSKKSGYPVRTEVVAGVKVITNPEYPRGGKVTYQLEEELSIGGDQLDENYTLNRPRYVKVAEDDTIYVLDIGDICIKVYDNQGQYLRTIGREGQGPGEFNRFFDCAIGSDGIIYILDSGNFRVSIMDANGIFIKSYRVSGGLPMHIMMDNNNFIYYEIRFIEEEKNKMSISRYNKNGEEVLKYGNFKVVQPVVKQTKTGSIATSSRVAPHTVWTVDQEGKLYAGYGDKYQISVYNPDGKISFKFGRDFAPIPDKYYKGEPNQHKYMSAFTVITTWLFDENGNIWIEIFPEEEAADIIYDIFSPEGIYIKQAYVKHRIFQLKNGKAYSIVTTDEGYRIVKRFLMVEKSKEE